MRRAAAVVGGALSALLALLALLIPFRAPTYNLWKLRVGVTE